MSEKRSFHIIFSCKLLIANLIIPLLQCRMSSSMNECKIFLLHSPFKKIRIEFNFQTVFSCNFCKSVIANLMIPLLQCRMGSSINKRKIFLLNNPFNEIKSGLQFSGGFRSNETSAYKC